MSLTISDKRSNTPEKPVWEVVYGQMSWASGGGHAAVNTDATGVNGTITQITCTPSVAGASSLTFDIDLYDVNDVKLRDIVAALDDAAGATTYTSNDFYDLPVTPGFYFKVDPNKDPSTGGTTMDITIRGV